MLSPPWCCPRFSRSPRLAKKKIKSTKQKFRNLSQIYCLFRKKKYTNISSLLLSTPSILLFPYLFIFFLLPKSNFLKRFASCLKVLRSLWMLSKQRKHRIKDKKKQLINTLWTPWEQQHQNISPSKIVSSTSPVYILLSNFLLDTIRIWVSLVFWFFFSPLDILYCYRSLSGVEKLLQCD